MALAISWTAFRLIANIAYILSFLLGDVCYPFDRMAVAQVLPTQRSAVAKRLARRSDTLTSNRRLLSVINEHGGRPQHAVR